LLLVLLVGTAMRSCGLDQPLSFNCDQLHKQAGWVDFTECERNRLQQP